MPSNAEQEWRQKAIDDIRAMPDDNVCLWMDVRVDELPHDVLVKLVTHLGLELKHQRERHSTEVQQLIGLVRCHQ